MRKGWVLHKRRIPTDSDWSISATEYATQILREWDDRPHYLIIEEGWNLKFYRYKHFDISLWRNIKIWWASVNGNIFGPSRVTTATGVPIVRYPWALDYQQWLFDYFIGPKRRSGGWVLVGKQGNIIYSPGV